MSIFGEEHDRVDEAVELEKLRAENLRLRDKLLELAKECSGCNGTGLHTVRGFEGHGKAFERQEPCRDCADIRAVLD